METSYNVLNENLESLDGKIIKIESNYKSQLEKLNTDSKNEYDSIKKRIESLLPDAMTAGLSSAFIKKKKEEEELYGEYKKRFRTGINLLSLVAFLPIAIGIYQLLDGIELIKVIERTPKIILTFLPLYIPLIWSTISANKKVNLSKRLIEEYSHKQVLSMTIEGLSSQIKDIEDPDLSEDLRIELLRNFLAVSSENPGKLILNYQKSDNPILNIFDKDKNNKTIKESMKEKTKDIIESAGEAIENDILDND